MVPVLPLVLGGTTVILLGLALSESTQGPSTRPPTPSRPRLPHPPSAWPGEPIWPPDLPQSPEVITSQTPPREVMDALIDQLASQSNAIGAKPMASLARRVLTVHEPRFSAIVLPCDQRLHRFLPDPAMLNRVSTALADSYEVDYTAYPAKWTDERLGSIALCAVVFHSRGTVPPSRQQVLEPIADSLRQHIGLGEFVYGASPAPREQFGILDVIVNAFVGAAAGTVSSLMVQDLYHAAGGERRLARLVRRYKRAAQQEGSRARRLLGKIKRTAERLKGRTVDWNEIEALIAKYDASQPRP